MDTICQRIVENAPRPELVTACVAMIDVQVGLQPAPVPGAYCGARADWVIGGMLG